MSASFLYIISIYYCYHLHQIILYLLRNVRHLHKIWFSRHIHPHQMKTLVTPFHIQTKKEREKKKKRVKLRTHILNSRNQLNLNRRENEIRFFLFLIAF